MKPTAKKRAGSRTGPASRRRRQKLACGTIGDAAGPSGSSSEDEALEDYNVMSEFRPTSSVEMTRLEQGRAFLHREGLGVVTHQQESTRSCGL